MKLGIVTNPLQEAFHIFMDHPHIVSVCWMFRGAVVIVQGSSGIPPPGPFGQVEGMSVILWFKIIALMVFNGYQVYLNMT